MKKLLIGTALATSVAASAFAGGHGKEVTIGVFLGFTGPIESMVAEMGPGAEFAISEVNESGALLDSAKVTAVRADTTCIDSGAAQAAIERLITAEGNQKRPPEIRIAAARALFMLGEPYIITYFVTSHWMQ